MWALFRALLVTAVTWRGRGWPFPEGQHGDGGAGSLPRTPPVRVMAGGSTRAAPGDTRLLSPPHCQPLRALTGNLSTSRGPHGAGRAAGPSATPARRRSSRRREMAAENRARAAALPGPVTGERRGAGRAAGRFSGNPVLGHVPGPKHGVRGQNLGHIFHTSLAARHKRAIS